MTGLIDYKDPKMQRQIRVTERQNTSFITGIRDGAVIGWKFFDFLGESLLGLEVRGKLAGSLTVSHDIEGRALIGEAELELTAEGWHMLLIPITPLPGSRPLYLRFAGEGAWELKSFCFFAE